MGRYLGFLFWVLCMAGSSGLLAQTKPAQPNLKLSGRVLHAQTRQPLPSVTVLRVRNRLGTITNEAGRFSFYVRPGDTLLVRSVGFKPLFYLVHPASKADLTVDILLEEGALELPEVKVVGGLDYEKVNRALRNMKKAPAPKVGVRPPAPKPVFEDKAPAPPPPPSPGKPGQPALRPAFQRRQGAPQTGSPHAGGSRPQASPARKEKAAGLRQPVPGPQWN